MKNAQTAELRPGHIRDGGRAAETVQIFADSNPARQERNDLTHVGRNAVAKDVAVR
jgi:hypothetical protein